MLPGLVELEMVPQKRPWDARELGMFMSELPKLKSLRYLNLDQVPEGWRRRLCGVVPRCCEVYVLEIPGARSLRG